MSNKNKENLIETEFEQYNNKMSKTKNDTVLSRWGMYSQDNRYKDDTAKVAKLIEDDMKLTNDQAYYMLYFMVTNKQSYKQAKEQMQVDPNFEMYKKDRGVR